MWAWLSACMEVCWTCLACPTDTCTLCILFHSVSGPTEASLNAHTYSQTHTHTLACVVSSTVYFFTLCCWIQVGTPITIQVFFSYYLLLFYTLKTELLLFVQPTKKVFFQNWLLMKQVERRTGWNSRKLLVSLKLFFSEKCSDFYLKGIPNFPWKYCQ